MGMDGKENLIMALELLEDLERRTGGFGPFERAYDEDRATCRALMCWLRGEGSTVAGGWQRLRLLLNYVHDRGARVGIEYARDVVRGTLGS